MKKKKNDKNNMLIVCSNFAIRSIDTFFPYKIAYQTQNLYSLRELTPK